jgi:uncharacterized protein (TIGR03382 family)
MKTMHLSLVAVAGATFIASAASADFTGISFADATAEVDAIANQSIPAGHTVWRVYANFDDPGDAFLNVTVDWTFDANLFQDPFGGDGPPNPAFYPVFANIASDSYVTHGVSQQPIDNLGFDPDFAWSPNGVTGGWFDSNPVSQTLPVNGQILIAQLTLPSAAVGGGAVTIFYEDAQIPGTATQGDGVLEIPSPGALALLGLAGLAGRRRRG